MELALDHTDSVVFEIDLESGRVSRHGSFANVFAVEGETVPTWRDHLRKLVHPADREAYRAFYESFEAGERDQGTLRYRTDPSRGAVRWIKLDVYLEEADPSRLIGIANDVTDRETQRAKREQVVERVTDAIVEVDTEWRFSLVNDQAEELYDMREADLLGMDFWEVFSAALETRFEEVYRRVMETREPESLVEYFDALDGWFAVDVYPNDDGGLAFYFREVSDRMEGERARRRVESRLRALAENFPNGGVLFFDETLTVEFAAGAVFEPLGLSPAELEGGSIADVALDAEDLVAATESFMRATLDGATEPIEVRYDGRTYELRSVPLRDDDGRITGGAIVSQDVTDRAARERSYDALSDGFPDHCYVVDEDGVYREVLSNPSNVDRLHEDSMELLGRTVADVLPDPLSEQVGDQIERTVERGETRSGEYELDVSAGRRVFETRSSPLSRPIDGKRAVALVVRDVTDRRERERRLERYERLVEALPDEVYSLDAAGRYTSVIPARGRERSTTGYTPEELEGEHVSMVLDDADQERGRAAIRELLSDPDRRTISFEVDRISKDGEAIPHEIHVAPLYADDGTFAGTVGVTRDISDRKERERALERKNEQLERFASFVSHDLRTPLSVVEGRLELAREDCDSPHLDEAVTAVERSNALIDDLLTLAREGDRIGDREPVDLAALAGQCWEGVAPAEASLVVETDAVLTADESRLTQLLENLVRNAIEHGGEDVTVTVGETEDGFFVADDGPGIPPERREDVFDVGHSKTADGTGFGLAIVRRIAAAHGWTVTATESDSGGARFEFSGVDLGE